MVSLSEALSFPFAVGCFDVPAATFRRFEELWQTLRLKHSATCQKVTCTPRFGRFTLERAMVVEGGSHGNLDASDQEVKGRPITCWHQLANPFPSPERWRKYRQPASSFDRTTFRTS